MGLAACLNAPGGLNAAQACERAALKLEGVREKALAAITDCLDDIAHVCAQGPPGPELRRELHRLSCSVAGLGGMFGRDALSKAAYCFCRLLDATESAWDAAAVGVHVGAMRLLLAPDNLAEAAQRELVDGLGKVRERAARAR